MTIIEYLQTHNAEEIASKIAHINGCDDMFFYNHFVRAFNVGPRKYFDEAHDCPSNCEYLEDGNCYEDSWMNGMCNKDCYGNPDEYPYLDEDEDPDEYRCPNGICREESVKRQIVAWLNREIDK